MNVGIYSAGTPAATALRQKWCQEIRHHRSCDLVGVFCSGVPNLEHSVASSPVSAVETNTNNKNDIIKNTHINTRRLTGTNASPTSTVSPQQSAHANWFDFRFKQKRFSSHYQERVS